MSLQSPKQCFPTALGREAEGRSFVAGWAGRATAFHGLLSRVLVTLVGSHARTATCGNKGAGGFCEDTCTCVL